MLRVPADHSSIQAAIEAATVGDEVIVEAGVYKERIQLKLGVALRSQGDNTVGELGLVRAERTIIDGAGDGR